MSQDVINFNGHGGGAEHRTTGGRAWCHDCGEWCYPQEPCGQESCCAEKLGYGHTSASARRAFEEAGWIDQRTAEALRTELSIVRQELADAASRNWVNCHEIRAMLPVVEAAKALREAEPLMYGADDAFAAAVDALPAPEGTP